MPQGEGMKPPVRANLEIGAPFGVEVLQVKSGFLTSRTPFGMTVFAGLNILCGGVGILLDRFDQAGQDGDGDGDVAGGDQDGDDFGGGAEDWGVDGMAEAQGLEDAPKAVIEVIAEHDHGDDVEERDGPGLEASDDVIVDVVFDERAAGMNHAKGEVEQVEDDEGEDDRAAPDHGAGGVGGMLVDLFNVGDGASGALKKDKLPGGPDVEEYGDEQGDAGSPEKRGHGMERGGIGIKFFGGDIDLEVAEEMGDDETEEDNAGDGHDGFFADGGLPEAQIGGRKIETAVALIGWMNPCGC